MLRCTLWSSPLFFDHSCLLCPVEPTYSLYWPADKVVLAEFVLWKSPFLRYSLSAVEVNGIWFVPQVTAVFFSLFCCFIWLFETMETGSLRESRAKAASKNLWGHTLSGFQQRTSFFRGRAVRTYMQQSIRTHKHIYLNKNTCGMKYQIFRMLKKKSRTA